MRLVYKKFSDDTFTIYHTDSSGRNRKVLEGKTPVIGRCDVRIEVDMEEVKLSEVSVGIDKMEGILVSFPRMQRESFKR